MRKLIGNIVGLLYVLSGVRHRKLVFYSKPGSLLTICGHNPSVEVLHDLLSWLLRHGFSFVDPDEILAMRDGGMPPKGKIAWLTFDDGWRVIKSDLMAILEKFQAKATIFIPPHEIERGQLWTNSIRPYVDHDFIMTLFKMPVSERERNIDPILSEHQTSRMLLSMDEIIELSKNKLITIENHTWSHLSCYHRPLQDVVEEVQKAQHELTSWIGRCPKFVCYPFGHYRAGCDEALAQMGLIGVHSDNGDGTINEVGRYRNMFRNDMGHFETIGRALNAWPNSHIRDAQ